LHGFLSFVRLSNQRDEELLIHLKSLVPDEPGQTEFLEFTPERASFYLNCKERYARELQTYFTIFHDFLLKESDKSKGLKVTTRTEQCLITLTDMIQQSLQHSESVLNLLSQFRRKLWTVERQTEEN
jgi:UDP-2,3-diacylglucosamine pyrophosphatase LpxH